MRVQPATERTVGTVEQQIDQPRHYRRNSKRNIQQRQQQLAAREVKTRHQPRQQRAKDQVYRYGNQRNHHRQPDCVQHVRISQVVQDRHQPFAEGLDEDIDHRHDQNESGNQYSGADQKPFPPVDAGRIVTLQLSNFRH